MGPVKAGAINKIQKSSKNKPIKLLSAVLAVSEQRYRVLVLVVVTAVAMHMPMGQFFFSGFTNCGDCQFEVQ